VTDIQADDREVEQPQLGARNTVDYDDDLVYEITENLRKGRDHWSEWRRNAKEDFDFYAGVQWSQEDAAKLEKEGRPPVVFNRVVRTINAVAGVEVQNRQEVTYYPRNVEVNQQDPAKPTDSGFSDMLNDAADWVRDQNDSEDEESDAFEDLLICGMSWTEMRMDYDEDPQGIIRKDRIDPLTMYVDPDSTKRNFEDAKWVACVREFSKREAREMFDLSNVDAGTLWNDDDMLVHDQTDEWKYVNDYSDQMVKVGKIKVAQYQYWVKEDVFVVLTPDGNIVTLTRKKYDKIKPMLDQVGIKAIKIKKKIFKQCFLVGNAIAEHRDLGCDHFTFRAMTGLRDRNRNIYFGLVQLMKDPQRWANKWLSQIQHILNSNSKGGVMVEDGAVDDIRDFEDKWASPDGVVEVLPGGLNKIKEKQQIQYPDGIDRLLNYAISAINDIPGINLEMVGMAARDQAIGLEMTRKEAGITVLATFFNSLRRYRKTDGRLLAYFIRTYIADGRLIRITGEDGVKYVPLMKSQIAFQYDIIVDESPTSPNSKEKTFAILTKILPMALQAGIAIPKEILDYAPLPYDFVQKWKQTIDQQSQPDPEQQAIQQKMQQIGEMLAQLQVAQAEADVQKTQSEVAKNMASAEKDHAVGQEQQALAMQKFGVLSNDQQLKSQAFAADQYRKDLELSLNQLRKLLEVRLTAQARMHESTMKNLPIPSLSEIQ